MDIKNKIDTYLSEIAEQYDYPIIPGASIEETILNTIIGTSRTIRLGALPSGEVRKNIITLSEKSSLIENCDEQCEVNFNALYEYWHNSEDVSINNSSEKLKKLGWMGEITPAMRDFYIKRMKGLYPNETLEFLTNKVIRFFAYTLFISQNDLMGRKNIEHSTIDVCLLRVPPPNMPKQLYSNRLRMRIAPKKVTAQSAPPWAVGGVLEYNNGNLHIKLLDTKTYNQTSLSLNNINYNNSSISIINVKE